MPRVAPLVVLVFLLALLLYLATDAPTITARNGGSDGGELAATALSGGVPHPSGYPTYMVLARLALVSFSGEAAGRLARLSSVAGACAAACTAWLIGGSAGREAPASRAAAAIGAIFGGLLCAVSARVWSQAVIAEVYAVYLAVLIVCVLIGDAWLGSGRTVLAMLTALCAGLGLGTHLTLLAFVPACGAAWLVATRRPPVSLRTAAGVILAFAAGLAIFGLLPLWGARHVVPSWGDTTNVSGLWQHISGVEYHYLVGIVPWSQRLSRLRFVAGDLLHQPGPVGLGLACFWGIPFCWRARRPLLTLVALIGVANLAFAIGYGAADGTVYLLPWTWGWCVLAGIGAGVVATEISAVGHPRWALPALVAVLVAAVAWPVGTQYTALDLHADYTERATATAELVDLPDRAILYTADDDATFGAWYVQRALALRPDVLVVDRRLLRQPWYQAQLARRLELDSPSALCSALLARRGAAFAMSAGGERQVLAGSDDAGCVQ